MKKAKFVVEIEYDEDADKVSTETVNIKRCEVEGDYKGLTTALSCGFAFSQLDGKTPLGLFKEKLLILRSVSSALSSILSSIKSAGYYKTEECKVTDKEEHAAHMSLKSITDIITFGLAKIFRVTEEQMKQINKEFNDGQEEKGKQTGRNDIGDFI